MKEHQIPFSLVIGIIFFTFSLHAKTISIGNGGDYQNLSAAQQFIEAGDTILV